jgi:DNA-binding PadR family transcriptional regulator
VTANHSASAQLDALGDPTRRAIFLKVLKDAGLLSVRREGTRNIYSANPDGIAVLRASVERFWRDALVAFKEYAEQKGSKQR